MSDFPARKAGDFDEITYTGTADTPYKPGDDLLPGAFVLDVTDDPDAKERTQVQRQEGVQITLKARDGKFHPHDAAGDAALAAFGLAPVGETKTAPADDKKGA